ncbi:MAG: hypothetical protein F4219_05805 [Gammaproteobacteria bacterium]|nr:hypothetical protein [Gammaproteobacteria bacterium]
MLLDPARVRFSTYFDWYENKIAKLFQVPATLINGLGLIGNQNITMGSTFNYMQVISRFYHSAVMNDIPRVNREMFTIIDQATEHWSVTGECCFIQQQGTIRVVRPDYVFPIRDPYDRDRILRFLFVFPYLDTQQGNFGNEPISVTQANVIDYDVETGRATMGVRHYTAGNLANTPVGTPVNIGQVFYLQSGSSIYPTIESLVREVSVRLNMLQLALNTSSVPIMQVDKDSLNDGALRGSVSLEDWQKQIQQPMGLQISPPFAGEEGSRFIERAGTGLEESMGYIRLMLSQLGVLTGVPDYVLGAPQLGRTSSETERTLFIGQARVNSYRRSLEHVLQSMGLEIRFVGEPFVSRSERLKLIVQQLQAGILTPNEARSSLGLEPLNGILANTASAGAGGIPEPQGITNGSFIDAVKLSNQVQGVNN